MDWIKTFKNKDGSYDSFDWSISDVINGEITTLLLTIFAISTCTELLLAFIY